MTKNAEVALRALFLPLVLFAFHLGSFILADAYFLIPWFDNVMHFFGGVVIAFAFAEVYKEIQKRKFISAKTSPALGSFFIVSGTSLIAVLWEFHEFLIDMHFFTRQQMSIQDTMGDLLFGITGAFLVSVWVAWMMRKKS